MTGKKQPEALRLADELERDLCEYPCEAVALVLRRQHARIAELEAIATSAGSEPVAWLVCSVNSDGTLSLEHAAAWQEAAHEHINDAITEHGIDEAASWVVRPAYTHPSPPEGMVGGWMPIATAPAAGLILLAVEDSAGERRVFAAEASHENGGWVWNVTLGWLGWTRLHSGWTPILWRRLPPPPTTSAGSGKGE